MHIAARTRCPGKARERLTLVLIRVRQQCQIARTLHCDCQLTLIIGFSARDAAGNDLTRLGDVCLQHTEVFVIDLLDAFGGKTTEFATAKKTRPGIAPKLWVSEDATEC